MIKEIKYGGFTATPDDYLAPDGELAAAINAVPENGALKPILPPSTVWTLPANFKPMFVHNTQPNKHYIFYNSTDGKLYWCNTTDDPSHLSGSTLDNVHVISSHEFSEANIYDINAIGNTLIVLTNDGPFYFLWKNSSSAYMALGTHLPELELAFSLDGALTTESVEVNCSHRNDAFRNDYPQEFYQFNNTDKEIISNAILGNINKHIADHLKNGRFVFPFLVRYAYRLFDGTLTMHSAPQLMIANTSTPWAWVDSSDVDTDDSLVVIGKTFHAVVSMMSFNLNFSVVGNDDTGNWSDIIKSVDVFISAPIYTYKQSGSCEGFINTSPDGFFVGGYFKHAIPDNITYGIAKYNNSEVSSQSGWFVSVPKRDDTEVMFDIQNCANFYLLSSYQVDSNGMSATADETISKDISSLIQREQMTDDYDSHDQLIAENEFIYNGRLNITTITKRHFHGFSAAQMVPKAATSKTTDAYVKLNVDGREGILKARQSSAGITIGAPLYLYYPSTSARQITLVYDDSGTTKTGTFDLKQHDLLNGSYYFEGWDAPTFSTGTAPTAATTFETKIKNKIYTSEVNNPFYFPVLGINTVGTGDIMAICSAVKALSQGQFGQFPLYAFTTEGVWSLEVSSTGTYTARQPVTRDVCTNPNSITQLDDSVLFATDRGIMLLTGSNAICITDDINNATPINLGLSSAITTLAGVACPTVARLTDFLRQARMVYDYTGQRIIIFNPTTATTNGVTAPVYSYAYVYSLTDKRWGMMESGLSYPINSYPEALAVNNQNKLVNLSQDVNSNTSAADDVDTVNTLIVTRPLKLDYPDALKTVNTIIQRGKFDFLKSSRNPKPVRCVLMGSVDLYNWRVVASSTDHYLRGFRGSPFKYFKIVLLGSLAPEETLVGCTVQYEPRLTNQPR